MEKSDKLMEKIIGEFVSLIGGLLAWYGLWYVFDMLQISFLMAIGLMIIGVMISLGGFIFTQKIEKSTKKAKRDKNVN
jgi:hypothetical protein